MTFPWCFYAVVSGYTHTEGWESITKTIDMYDRCVLYLHIYHAIYTYRGMRKVSLKQSTCMIDVYYTYTYIMLYKQN